MVNAGLHMDRLTGRWGAFHLEPVQVRVPAGAYAVLLGPSGCGKTTLLELLCGLRGAGGGRIELGGRDITRADPAGRRIGYVPQEYHLFPGRSAEWNIRFSTRMRKARGHEIQDRFSRIVDALGLDAFLTRRVDTLSGGERQRVALARALMTDPELLLLDEPVSALPESLRDPICRELKDLQTRLGITTLHVCHNLDEALALGSHLIVMDTGCVVQEGAPWEILDRPASRFVAEFTQCGNLWEAEVRAGRVLVQNHPLGRTAQGDGRYWAVLRSEYASITNDGAYSGRVLESVRACHSVFTRVALDGFALWAGDTHARTPGETVSARFAEERLHLIARS